VPARLFTGFGYQVRSWPHPRWVIAKVEANAQGTNCRLVVSSLPRAELLVDGTDAR